MSCEVGIDVDHLDKVYNLFDRDTAQLSAVLFGREADSRVWALRDVNFRARAGDVIGLIGRNGAGKSTLLEILAGTREPSAGSVRVRGRVAAMLELGAGFNPDFTGAENARLCASAYGLTSRQISARMDDIARFAGIEAFMDRPTREYSSGMFARLAFAVCAHVDADILIVDEILGVGDVQFQQRSMRFLHAFARERIVLMASHDETMIPALCNRALLLDRGRVAMSGRPKDVAHAYHRLVAQARGGSGGFQVEGTLSGGEDDADQIVSDAPVPPDAPESGPRLHWDFDSLTGPEAPGRLVGAALETGGAKVSSVSGGEEITFSIDFRVEPGETDLWLAFAVRSPLGQIVFFRDLAIDVPGAVADPGDDSGSGSPALRAQFGFIMPYLVSGAYAVDVVLFAAGRDGIKLLDRKDLAASFTMISGHLSTGVANLGQLGAQVVELDAAP